MKIVPYDPKYKADFVEMNRAWISEMFCLEPEDLAVMDNIAPALKRRCADLFRPGRRRPGPWPAV